MHNLAMSGLEPKNQIRWKDLLRPQWVLTFVAASTIGLLVSYWHQIQIESDVTVVLRAAITAEGQPFRPISELAAWLNGRESPFAGSSVKWRPFIASHRYEGTDNRLSVLAAYVDWGRSLPTDQESVATVIAKGIQAEMEIAEVELAAVDQPIVQNSSVLWVRSYNTTLAKVWKVVLAQLLATLFVLNFFALTASKAPSSNK